MRNPYDAIGRIAVLLAILGAINWLLVGLFQWNLVSRIFTGSATQTATTGERIVYVVVGVGGILAIPMIAATLARSRSRDVEDAEGRRSDAAPDETADVAAQGQPVRTTERVVMRTVEPITVPSDDASVGTTGSPTQTIDDRLRYGTVEESDLDEGDDQQQRAA